MVLVALVALVGPAPLPADAVAAPGSSAHPSTPTVAERAAPRHGRKKAARFEVASFNVLGHRHSAKGGNASKFASGRKRMRWTHRLIQAHGVDVVGFQELQPEQLDTFNRLTRKRWAVYPGGRLERIAMHNSVAWRTKVWKRMDATWVKIPYFKGEKVKMPVVTLRHRASGRIVRFANFHNPADSRGPAQKLRNEARRKQVALTQRLTRKGHLVITGDMNERRRYYCHLTRETSMKAANGGSHRRGRCRPPKPMDVDWIFGSSKIRFPHFRSVKGPLVSRTSNHPFVVAAATIRRGSR